MRKRGTISLVLKGPQGQFYERALDLDPLTLSEWDSIKPLSPFDMSVSETPFNDAVTVIKERVFRKDFFIDTCKRLGGQLAEMLEDKEGWHGQDRMG